MENNHVYKKYRWMLRLLPALLMMILIFIHSAMPADLSSQESSFLEAIVVKLFQLDADTASFFVRKCAHFLEYLVLGVCLMFFADHWTMPENSSVPFHFLRHGLPAWGFGVFYAVTDEVHQYFVPGRSCEFRDMCIDAAGAMAGVWIYLLVQTLKNRRKQKIAKSS